MKEIEVRLLRTDSGNCMEIWESRRRKGVPSRYFARDTYGSHAWSHLCDAPYGYCEKDCHVSPDIVFVICDRRWNPLLRVSNAADSPDFPTLEELCLAQWKKHSPRFAEVTRSGFGEWILSKATVPLYNAAELNWRDMWNSTVRVEHLAHFSFLGEPYTIQRHTLRHDRCDVLWYEYYAGHREEACNGMFAHWFGYEFSDALSERLLEEQKHDTANATTDI